MYVCMYIYIYIYIYICVCVCVCVCEYIYIAFQKMLWCEKYHEVINSFLGHGRCDRFNPLTLESASRYCRLPGKLLEEL